MMKKIFMLLGAFVLLCSQVPHDTFLRGKVKGFVSDDSLWIWSATGKDTIAAPNGEFTYQFKEEHPGMVRIFKYPKTFADGKMEALRMNPISLLMFPGQSLEFSGDFDSYSITGNAFYEEYNRVKNMLSHEDSVRISINKEYMQLMRAEAPRNEIMSKFEELKEADAKLHERMKEYVDGHMDSYVSLFLLYKYRPQFGEKYMDKFTEKIKNGELKEMYTELSSHYAKMAARRAAASVIKEGKTAPDFLLKDINGKDFALSSLRGKYVVLDFWGSWCGWCIKGIPEMKKMYEKYKDRLEIVGVDCRDSEQTWKDAVKKYDLKWTNVINNTERDKDMTLKYNISGFPTKIIISPDGRIVKIVVGEKPEFYDTIEKLMKE